MARGAQLLLAAVAVSLAISACGGSNGGSSSTAGERPAGGISDHDYQVIGRIQTDIRGWNKAARTWVKAFGSNDPDRFLAAHQRSLKPLNSAVAGIEGGSRQIADRPLRGLLASMGTEYREQFDAIVDIGDAARVGDQSAVGRGLKKLRRANRRKGKVADELVDRFPELGRAF
jgi:hypothetical protein